jgi:tetratricopeptide (TPR) repeat protein
LAPLDFDEDALPISVKAELRGVPSDVAHIIEGHLVAAAEALEEDPKLAHEHAQAALRRAARLPVLREVAAETAYAAGEYSSALNDYRALRRMTGNDNLLPVMADCERALGRPQAALKLIREAEEGGPLSSSQQVELVLVKAGARQDLGQEAEARRLLHAAVQSVQASDEAKARLYYGYAEMLLASGDTAGAKSYFASAEELDASELLDAADRLAELSAGPADGADEGADEKIDDQDDQDDKDVQK